MDEIIRFVMLAQSARFTVRELCEQFGISRKTGYKHLERYAADGLKGLAVRSHRPHQFPQRTDSAVEALILAERRLHRTWGAQEAAQGFGSEAWHRVCAGPQHHR
jgi:transposase